MRSIFVLVFGFLAFTAAAQQNIDVKSYHFELELSDKWDAITGMAIIDVQFLEDATEVSFDLTSMKDDRGMYAFKVSEWGKETLQSNHKNDILRITLASKAKKGEWKKFQIEYMGTPEDGLIISKNKYGDRTFFADNWPDRARHWIPCVDKPNDKAAVEFLVTAPSQYKVIANGVLVSEDKIDATRTKTFWREVRELPTKVMVIGAAKFAVKEFSDSPKGIPVSAWVYPQDSTKGFYDYAVAPGIVKFFSDYIGPFPYKKLANVQSKTVFGGMENASAIFYAENYVTGDRSHEDVIAHEIAHQWFGDMATEKSYAHIWLSEGFANYFTNFYFEKKYGREAAIERFQKEKEEIFEFLSKNSRPVVDSTSDLMSLLNANSYQKGSWVLYMLRNEVGDEKFQEIIRAYYESYGGYNAETRDFQKIAERITSRKLDWFFNQWLYRPGVPDLTVQTKNEKKEIKLVITQGKDFYILPLEVLITFADGSTNLQKLMITSREYTLKIKGKGPIKTILDPDHKLLFTSRIK